MPRLEFRRVDVPRRIAIVVVAVSLGLPAAASAQDGTTALPPSLTPTPTGTGTANGNANNSNPSSNGSNHGSSLPTTGLDGRLFGLLGLSLLVSGIGLRMRTADERF